MVDVDCYGNSTGEASIAISGGTAPYTVEWSNGDSELITEWLTAGEYSVDVTDSRGCQVSQSFTINQPEIPISIDHILWERPSHNMSNGSIIVNIYGGNDVRSGSYSCHNSSGEEFNSFIEDISTSEDTLTLVIGSLPTDSYTIDFTDIKGCSISSEALYLPSLITGTLSQTNEVLCNSQNLFFNPYNTASISSTIMGGTPYKSGAPYRYVWTKVEGLDADTGEYSTLDLALPYETTSVLEDIEVGLYSLNVTDSLGDVIGVYDNDNLVESSDLFIEISEPELLSLSISTTEISCERGNDGTATVDILGGVAPYTIFWSNGDTTLTAHNLIGGEYLVRVFDFNGCEAELKTEVAQPGELKLSLNIENPTCTEESNGSISMDVEGGVAPYSYIWSTGAVTKDLDNLSEGVYLVEITDAKGCIAFQEVTLTDPEPLYINLGDDKVLCLGQVVDLDISVDDSSASYIWESTNGFSSEAPQVTLEEPGSYIGTIINSVGCSISDTINISNSATPINAEFLIATDIGINEDIVMINTSNPIGENSEWILPEDADVVSESSEMAVIRFQTEGEYEITLRSIEGDCFEDYIKVISVDESTTNLKSDVTSTTLIRELNLFPNPNSGRFTASIKLNSRSDIRLSLLSLPSNNIISQDSFGGLEEYLIPFNKKLSHGIYYLIVEAGQEKRSFKIIVTE